MKNFLRHYNFDLPNKTKLEVIEQGLPGTPVLDEDEAEKRGLPDGLIYNDNGCALIIESKIRSTLTRDQLQRHVRTVRRCGFDQIQGLAITVDSPDFRFKNWRMVTWKDIYGWACAQAPHSIWAQHVVEYFNVAEQRMTQQEYLTEGTITEFSGIDINPYAYLEAKRVLRLLTDKVRANSRFMKHMGLDPKSRRSAITNDFWGVWDYISCNTRSTRDESFTSYPHFTFGISNARKAAEVTITFPNAMNRSMAKRLIGSSYEDFSKRMEMAFISISKNLRSVKGHHSAIRIVQRHYKSQRAKASVDGEMMVDLRACFGGKNRNTGRNVKKQEQWLRAAYELLTNKRSNIQFQIVIAFPFDSCPQLKSKDADKIFISGISALRPLVKHVLISNQRKFIQER